MNTQVNKWEYHWVVQGNYGYGHGYEDLTQFEEKESRSRGKRARKEAYDELKTYRENAPEGTYRLVQRRELNPEYKKIIDEIVEHYVIALLWSDIQEDGTPVDDDFGPEDLTEEAMKEIREDCENFYKEAKPYIEKAGMSLEQFGDDFCLTRNGHGAGFWDRGLGEIGEKLSAMTEPYGCQHVMDNGDGQLIVTG